MPPLQPRVLRARGKAARNAERKNCVRDRSSVSEMSSVDSGFPDSDLLSSTAHSSSYNSFGSQNGDAAWSGGGGGGAAAVLNTPSGRNSSSASGDILRMVLEEEEEEEEEEGGGRAPRGAAAASDVLTINAAVQTGGVVERHRLWSASVFV